VHRRRAFHITTDASSKQRALHKVTCCATLRMHYYKGAAAAFCVAIAVACSSEVQRLPANRHDESGRLQRNTLCASFRSHSQHHAGVVWSVPEQHQWASCSNLGHSSLGFEEVLSLVIALLARAACRHPCYLLCCGESFLAKKLPEQNKLLPCKQHAGVQSCCRR
jgi:hypothetical protein